MSILATGGVSFKNKKETDFANSVKGNSRGKRLGIMVIGLVKVTRGFQKVRGKEPSYSYFVNQLN